MIIRGFSDHFLLTRGKVFTASIIEAFTTKLKAYSLSLLKREYDYLLNRGQVTKVGFSYSSSMNILSRVLKGSILGSLLFKFFYVTCFLESENFFSNYADDTTPCAVEENAEEVITELHGFQIIK